MSAESDSYLNGSNLLMDVCRLTQRRLRTKYVRLWTPSGTGDRPASPQISTGANIANERSITNVDLAGLDYRAPSTIGIRRIG